MLTVQGLARVSGSSVAFRGRRPSTVGPLTWGAPLRLFIPCAHTHTAPAIIREREREPKTKKKKKKAEEQNP